MHGKVGSPHVLELGLDLLFGRIDDDRGALAEDELLDDDEPSLAKTLFWGRFFRESRAYAPAQGLIM
jgi:hypothetical protein